MSALDLGLNTDETVSLLLCCEKAEHQIQRFLQLKRHENNFSDIASRVTKQCSSISFPINACSLLTQLDSLLMRFSLINGLCIKVACSAPPKDALVVTVKEKRGWVWRVGVRVLRANKRPANRKCCRLTDTLPRRPLNRIHLFAYYANELLKV